MTAQPQMREITTQRIHCPACGEESEIPAIEICPGSIEWRCPHCGTRFTIEMSYYERGCDD